MGQLFSSSESSTPSESSISLESVSAPPETTLVATKQVPETHSSDPSDDLASSLALVDESNALSESDFSVESVNVLPEAELVATAQVHLETHSSEPGDDLTSSVTDSESNAPSKSDISVESEDVPSEAGLVATSQVHSETRPSDPSDALEASIAIGHSFDLAGGTNVPQTLRPSAKLDEGASTLPSAPESASSPFIALLLLGRFRIQVAKVRNGLEGMSEERSLIATPLDPLVMRSTEHLYGDVAFTRRQEGYKIEAPLANWLNGAALLAHLVTIYGLLPQASSRMAIAVPVSSSEGNDTSCQKSWYSHERNSPEAKPALDAYLDLSRRLGLAFAEHPSKPRLLLLPSPLAVLHSQNMRTGLVVDVGMFEIRVVPVVDFRILWDYVAFLPIGSFHMLEYLRALIRDRASFSSVAEKEILQDFIPNLYVSTTLNDLTLSVHPNAIEVSQVHHVPGSGTSGIHIDRIERYSPCELFFTPAINHHVSDGMGVAVAKVLNAIAANLPANATELGQNIILTGRITDRPGFAQRLQMEVNRLVSFETCVAVSKDRNSNVMGLAALATLFSTPDYADTFQEAAAHAKSSTIWKP